MALVPLADVQAREEQLLGVRLCQFGADEHVARDALNKLVKASYEPPRVCWQLYSAGALRDVPPATGDHGIEGYEQLSRGGYDRRLRAFSRPFQAPAEHIEGAGGP